MTFNQTMILETNKFCCFARSCERKVTFNVMLVCFLKDSLLYTIVHTAWCKLEVLNTQLFFGPQQIIAPNISLAKAIKEFAPTTKGVVNS